MHINKRHLRANLSVCSIPRSSLMLLSVSHCHPLCSWGACNTQPWAPPAGSTYSSREECNSGQTSRGTAKRNQVDHTQSVNGKVTLWEWKAFPCWDWPVWEWGCWVHKRWLICKQKASSTALAPEPSLAELVSRGSSQCGEDWPSS